MMAKDDNVYRALQKHLDQHPIGYPKSISGSDLKVLKHIFTPNEARVATFLDYRFQSIEKIYEKHAASGYLKEDIEKTLDQIASKGGIGYRNRDGKRFYCNMPLVVGMYEGFLENLTPDFIKDFEKYTASPSFGISFLSTAVPQMRTIPVAESITPEHQISTFDQVSALIHDAPGPFAVIECICRKKKNMEGEKCRVTDRKETCMAANEIAAAALEHGIGREISKQGAIDLLAENTKEGLVLQPSNTQEIEFVCSCCGCCCGMLSIQKQLPRPLDFWSSNYFAVMDMDKCTKCGICARKCQVDAITVKKKNKKIVQIKLDSKKCIGCGNSVAACKFDAISLMKKKQETIPPKTFEELNEILMKNKKGTWDKVKMVSKMVLGLPQ
jgi:electron transport complex protein RnfB